MAEQRTAVIDMGSNSFRLVVFTAADGWWKRTDEIYLPVRIGEGLDATGKLGKEPMKRALEAAEVFAALLRGDRHARAQDIKPVATSAIRDASNQHVFLDRVRDETGLEVRVLSRDEEAYYGYLAAVNSTTLADGAVLDLGGGSLQLVEVLSRHPGRLGSWPLGAVRMTEHFLAEDDPPTKKARKAMRAHVRETLEREADWLPRAGRKLVGIGGTMRNLASAIQAADGPAVARRHPGLRDHAGRARRPRRAPRRDAGRRARRRQGHQVRPRRPHPRRRDGRPGGARARRLRVDHGHRGRPARGRLLQRAPRRRPAAVRRRARRERREPRGALPRRPQAHRARRAPSRSRSSTSSPSSGLHPGDRWERELLFSACVLHDIGMSVDYDDHHKHSRYLILNAGLPGFDPREVALVAQAARYHRKGMPDFGELAPLAEEGDDDAPRPPVDPPPARRGPRAQPRPERPRRARGGRQRHDPPRARGRRRRRGRALGGPARGRALRARLRARPEGRGDRHEPHPGRRPARPQHGGDELHDRVAGAQDPLRARRAPPARVRRRDGRARHPPRAPAARDRHPAGRLRAAGGLRPDAAGADRHHVALPVQGRRVVLVAARRRRRCARTPIWGYEAPLDEAPWLRGYAALYPAKADRWLVEDEPVAGGLRDPYHRVDVHTSSRPVRVTAAGELIARSAHPTLVFETSMPVRAYLPRGDVIAGHLRPSDKTSTDPYMGDAIYWHVHAGGELLPDAAHCYELPRAEAMKIAGLVCFSGEGVEVRARRRLTAARAAPSGAAPTGSTRRSARPRAACRPGPAWPAWDGVDDLGLLRLELLEVVAVAEDAEVAGDAVVAVDRDAGQDLLALVEAQPLHVEVRQPDPVRGVRRVLAVVRVQRDLKGAQVGGDLLGGRRHAAVTLARLRALDRQPRD